MKEIKILICSCLLTLVYVSSLAQDKIISIDEKSQKSEQGERTEKVGKQEKAEKYGKKIKEVKLSDIDSLKIQVAMQDTLLKEQAAELVLLREIVTKDSISLAAKDKRIAELEYGKNAIESCMLSLANRWLFVRFDEVEIDKVIEYFERILSNELREKYGVILELLNAYEPAYNEFKSLLLEAQNDSERGNVFCRDDYANKYLSRLKAMDYYKKYYKQSWSIRYLDDLITSAVEKLNNHRSGVTADFGDLFLVKKGV